jgi:hypothetical protein
MCMRAHAYVCVCVCVCVCVKSFQLMDIQPCRYGVYSEYTENIFFQNF